MPKVITDLKLVTDELGVQHLEMKTVELRTFGSQMFENPITGEESEWLPVPVELAEVPEEIIPGNVEETVPVPEVVAVEPDAEELVIEEIEAVLEVVEKPAEGVSTETTVSSVTDTGW